MARFAQWLFDEAASGTTPTTVDDDSGVSPDADFTTIDYGGGSWTTNGAGRGLTGQATQALNASSKVYAELDGATAASVIAQIDTPDDFFFVWWLPDTTDGETTIGVYVTDTGAIGAFDENSTGGFWLMETGTGIVQDGDVIAFVFDPGNATEADRGRIYRNGSRVATPTYTAPSGALDPGGPGTTADLYTGSAFGDPAGATIYYLAAYDSALSDAEVATLSSAIATDNDADPEAGGGGGTSSPVTGSSHRNIRTNAVYRM